MTQGSPDLAGYAVALFELGQAAGVTAALERELTAVSDLLDREAEICQFLADPHPAAQAKAEALDALLRGKVQSVLLHVLLVLVEQGQGDRLREFVRVFGEVARLRDPNLAAELTAAVPLAPEQVAAIETVMSARLGRPVKFRVRVDPRVIGGVSAKVGDVIVDGTVAHRLEQLREALVKA